MKRRASALVISLLTVFIILGCGKEVGRVSFTEVGTGETELTLDAGKDVDFWTNLDLTLDEDISLAHSIMAEADVSLAYTITLYQQGQLIKQVSCDPFDVSTFDIPTKFKSIRTSIRATRSFRYLGKMRCSTSLPNSDLTKIEAFLAAVNPADGSITDMPEHFKLAFADLVIKQ